MKTLAGLLSPLRQYTRAAVFVIFAALTAALAVQTVRLSLVKSSLKLCEAAPKLAAAESEVVAATAAVEGLEIYASKQSESAPVLDRVVERTRNVCLPAVNHLPMRALAQDDGQTGREAADRRADEEWYADREWIAAVEEDLRTCQAELNRLDFIRDFHNRQVKQ